MKAVEISVPGPPDVLTLTERPDPVAAADEVLIAVSAAGVNRPDVLQRLGKYPVPPGASDIPGLEVAGVVAAIGSDVRGWKVGDPIFDNFMRSQVQFAGASPALARDATIALLGALS